VNIPRQRLLRDETLLEIAATAPADPDQLSRARGISRGFAEGRTGASLLVAIAEAKALPEDALPEAPRSRAGARPSPALVSLLKVLLAAKCEDHHVAARLVASSDDIDRLVTLALKQGRVALGVQGRRVKLIPA
jgi:ribonuclease D